MIFEIRTYQLKPGTVPNAVQAFADKIENRVKLSPLAGFWHTEVGELNKIIHIWPYKDINERNEIRAKAVETKVWPPAISDFVTDMESKIVYPAAFSPNFQPGEHGTCYEFRTYTYGAGAIPKVMESWSKHIGERTKVSPLIFAGYTEIGPLNQWIHVWAYKNMGERERLRAAGLKPGSWPPPRPEGIVMHRMVNTLAIPAAFSPLK
jgi:hypothetical protein